MIENLKRTREPLAWILMGLILLGMGLTVGRLVTALDEMPCSPPSRKWAGCG